MIFEPLDFIARLAALVPKPRVNLTRYHGVFAPNSRYRGRVTKAMRGRGGRRPATGVPKEPTPVECRATMTWAQRLKRVFRIDIETCQGCGGAVRIIACIEDPVVIEKILPTSIRKTPRRGRACSLKGGRRLPVCSADRHHHPFSFNPGLASTAVSTYTLSSRSNRLKIMSSGILPVLLKQADVPPLLRDIHWLDMTDGDVNRAVARMLEAIRHFSEEKENV